MKLENQVTGVAALLLSFIYIFAFVYYGAFWNFPSQSDVQTKMDFIADHQFVISVVSFISYILFGLVLSVLVAGTLRGLQYASDMQKSITAAFGYIWVGLVVASGMIAISGVNYAVNLAETDAQKAFDAWRIMMAIAQSIGGENEIVGAVWVILVSVLALKSKLFSSYLNYLGLVIGIAGVATVTPFDVFTEVFGVLQIVWFFWLGVSFLRQKSESTLV